MKFELEESLRGATDEELLEDLRRSAKALGRGTITRAEYEQVGKGNPSTFHRRFGSWPKALSLAGLQPSRSKIGITDDELFENIKSLWISFGRQPRYNEVRTPSSRFSAGTYERRFGTWSKALGRFVEWVNADAQDQDQPIRSEAEKGEATSTVQNVFAKRSTRREITDRQRFRILVRDGFRCKSCGASPLVKSGIELHVDHILPWSKGGETTDENLESKCKQCNLGKGNAFNA